MVFPFTKLLGVTEKDVRVGTVNIVVVTPVLTLSIASPLESVVDIENELVVARDLGFCNPEHVIVKGVPVEVYAPLENALLIFTVTGLVDVVVVDNVFDVPVLPVKVEVQLVTAALPL